MERSVKRLTPDEITDKIDKYIDSVREMEDFRWGTRDELMKMAAMYGFRLGVQVGQERMDPRYHT